MRYLLVLIPTGAVILAAVLLAGCTLQSAVALHCKGECNLDVDRGIDIKAPEPQATIPPVKKEE